MKRFIGYLMMCISILISVFVGFIPTFYNVNASGDYASGREFIYQIKAKSLPSNNMNYINENSDSKTEEDLVKDIDDVLDTLKDRLNKAEISNPIVEKLEGKNVNEENGIYTIRVAYKAQYEQLYDAINSYLTFDWNLSVSIIQDNYSPSQNNSEGKAQLFKRGKATLDTNSGSPIIKLPLANQSFFYDNIYKKVTSSSEDTSNAFNFKDLMVKNEDTTTDENTPEDKDYIYIVNNWANEYNIESAVSSSTSSSYYSEAVNNVLYKLNTKSPSDIFEDYDANNESKDGYSTLLIKYSDYLPSSLNSVTDKAVLQRLVLALSKIELNKLNSNSIGYDIVLLNSTFPTTSTTTNVVPALVEKLKSHGNLTLNALLYGTIAAFILVALFMTLNYGLPALGGFSLVSATTLCSAALLSFFGVEFNIGTILALITVAVISIFSVCIYFNKVKEACYSGKALKKANTEASKKTLIYHVDISLITLIVGVIGYLFNNPIIMSIGAILIVGGLLNFMFNGLVLRGLYWLLANSSYIEEHINLLRIRKDFIPDLSKDEKPTYFDEFKKAKVTKKNTIITSVILGLLLVGSIISLPLTTALKGNVYGANISEAQTSQIYIQYNVDANDESKNGFTTITNIEENLINNIVTKNNEKASKLSYTTGNTKVMYYTTTIDDKGNNQYTFTYVIKLNAIYDDSANYYYVADGSTNIPQTLEAKGLVDVVSDIIKDGTIKDSVSNATVYLGTSYNYSDDYLNYDAFIYIVISIAIASAYILLRYGFGKFVISLLFVSAISTISIGFFSILQVGYASTNTIGLVLIIMLAYGSLLYYFTKEKDYLKDNHSQISSLNDKEQLLSEIHAISRYQLLNISGISLLAIVPFIISQSFKQTIILMVVLSFFLIMLGLNSLLDLSEHVCLITWERTKSNYHKMTIKHQEKIEEKNKKNKKKAKDTSDGPQEATFIGIND